MQPLDKETLSYWVTHPNDLTDSDFQQLQESLQVYPYCQALYSLTAKAASIHQKSQTITFARKAAAYALSRNALRRLIDNEFQWSDHLLSRLNELSTGQVPIPDDYQQESYALFKSKSGLNNGLAGVPLIRLPEPKMPELVIPEPDELPLLENTLQTELAQQPTAEQPEPAPAANEEERQRQSEIIDTFIRNEPRIAPFRAKLTDPVEQVDLAQRNTSSGLSLATESFAKILIKQGKVNQAIEIYEKLLLKNPDKKAYFASRIDELRENPANADNDMIP
ncbi:hypothetical protein [Arsenicibacter rosenii]|uniref:Uncharacterized protein n=1 Tax=Arsenicibacter rosenii TaxID=1750698 RepID=A0A1S2VS36_9BACT|nr:hypothetical protein [Arsenicibacter rosenii]OIN61096.1 hypothetical protein BLX24_03245 [Arsenicibacter rosenii]